MPAALATNLSPSDLVTFWNHLFDKGKVMAMSCVIPSIAGFFYAAYRTSHHPLNMMTVLGMKQSTQLALAGATVLSTVPFTFLVLGPRSIRKLQARRTAAAGSGVVDAVEVGRDVNSWTVGNSIRSGIFGVGFLLGVTAL